MNDTGAVDEGVRAQKRAERWREGIGAGAEARRAPTKLQPAKDELSAPDGVEPEKTVAGSERLLRRLGAVMLMLVVLGGGAVLLLALAFDGGKGYQVAPVLALMGAVLFGIPGACVLAAHVRDVWRETE